MLELEDSLSSKDHYEKRPRVCNLGYLRTPYQRSDGKIIYRCASEPIEDYLKKDGGALRSPLPLDGLFPLERTKVERRVG